MIAAFIDRSFSLIDVSFVQVDIRWYRCLRCQITGDAGRIGDTGATDYRWGTGGTGVTIGGSPCRCPPAWGRGW